MENLPTLEFYANDTKPFLEITLDDGVTEDAEGNAVDPTPIDLTDVRFVLIKVAENYDAVSNKFVGECEVIGEPVEGTVRYQFKDDELERGGWIGEISLVYSDYKVQTVGNFKLKVKPDLPNSPSGY